MNNEELAILRKILVCAEEIWELKTLSPRIRRLKEQRPVRPRDRVAGRRWGSPDQRSAQRSQGGGRCTDELAVECAGQERGWSLHEPRPASVGAVVLQARPCPPPKIPTSSFS